MSRRAYRTLAACCALALVTFGAKAAEIHDAVAANNVDRVKQLLAENPKLVDARDEICDATPLHWATTKEAAELLIAAKANVNAPARNGMTPLHFSVNAATGYLFRNLKTEMRSEESDALAELRGKSYPAVTAALLEHGATADAKDQTGSTPLMRAANKDAAEVLVAHGAAVDARDMKGRTALHTTPSADVAEFLLDRKVDVSARDTEGLTPLHTCWDASIAMVLIKHHGDVNAKSKIGQTPIYFQTGTDAVQITKLLIANDARLDIADEKGLTPLKSALEHQRYDVAQVIAANRVKVDIFDAAILGLTQQLDDFLKGDPALVNARDKTHRTPLHWAAERSHADAVSILLKHNAAVDARDVFGRTPLICAGRAKPEVARILLEHKADIDAFDSVGHCVLEEAMTSRYGRDEQDLLESFRRKGSNELIEAISDHDAPKVQQLLDSDPKLAFTRDHSAATPLHWAAVKSSPEVARILLRYRADVNADSYDEGTPLLDAALLGDKAMARLLIDNGATVDVFAASALGMKDKLQELLKGDPSLVWVTMHGGQTALHLAARTGQVGSAELLLAEKANVNATDQSGQTPLDYAIAANQDAIVKMLQDHHAKLGKRGE